MKKHILTCAALLLTAITVVLSAGCGGKGGKSNAPSSYNYVENNSTLPTGTDPDPTEPGATQPADTPINVVTDWQKNYDVEYKYYEPSLSNETETIRETLCDGFFTAIYPLSGNFVYYEENGANLECYIAAPAENDYLHSVLKNKKVSNLSTTFMKLTSVDAGFTALSNVLYMGEETVADRTCKKYIQRAYSDGAVTKTVYVWIDAQYGFALKCEAYNAADQLETYWEVSSFRTGGVTKDDLGVDISKYTFKDKE